MEGDYTQSHYIHYHYIISIHSLRMEGDDDSQKGGNHSTTFQSTPSVWRETGNTPKPPANNTFQSTPSVWRETMCCIVGCTSDGISIHSLRMEGDPLFFKAFCMLYLISIHSLRMEGDPAPVQVSPWVFYFNPLPPYGGRP